MGLFDRFNKKEAKAPAALIPRTSIFDTEYPLDKGDVLTLYSACLGPVRAVQEACSEHVVKGRDWHVDFRSGYLAFGKSQYPVQFVGSESSASDTWKWGWDNINGLDESLLKLTNETKAWGEKWGVEVLTTPDLMLDEVITGHNMAVLACGLSQDKYCYYRGPYDGGAVMLAFSDVPDSVFQPVELERFVRIAVQCLEGYPIDHKIFFEAFLHWNHTPYKWVEKRIEAEFNQLLIVEFEEADDSLHVVEIKMLPR